jgi:hypothetical protein
VNHELLNSPNTSFSDASEKIDYSSLTMAEQEALIVMFSRGPFESPDDTRKRRALESQAEADRLARLNYRIATNALFQEMLGDVGPIHKDLMP